MTRQCTNPACHQPLAEDDSGAGLCSGCARGTIISASNPSLRGFHVAGVDEAVSREADTLPLPGATLPTDPEIDPATVVSTCDADRIGRFVLRRFLGEGAFGRVYHAYDPLLDREVALKVAKPEHLASPERRQRFFREARAAAHLRHPHIVPLFEMGQDGPHAFIASALINGQTLEDALNAAPEGRLALDRAAWIVLHLAEALDYAHAQHIVHRDVKPANIMVEGDLNDPVRPPIPLLMDFGLAGRADRPGESRLTHDGTIMGTPLYMSPETCAGTCGEPMPVSDQYSLGVVLYELLTGQTPFSGPVQAVLMLHQTQEPPPPHTLRPDLPRDLETIVLKSLAKDPRRRYASCQELADDLRRYLAGEPIRGRRMSPLERLWRGAKANPTLAILSVAFVAFLIGFQVLVSSLYFQADRDRIRAINSENLAEDRLKQTQEQSRRIRLEADKARAVTRFLVNTLEASDPLGLSALPSRIPRETGERLTAVEVLDRGAASINADTTTPAPIRAVIHETIGGVYRSLGRYPEAERHLRSARELRLDESERDPLDEAMTLHNLGWLLHELGHYLEAEKLYRQALKLRQEAPNPDPLAVHATQFNLAWLLGEMQRDREAIRAFEELLKARLDQHGESSREVAITRLGLAAVHIDASRMVEAVPFILRAMEYFQKQEGGQSLGKAVVLFQQALLADNVFGNFAAAEKAFRESERLAADAMGPHSIYVQLVRFELAELYAGHNKLEQAENLYRAVVDYGRKQVSLAHPKFHLAVKKHADVLIRRNKPAEAVTLFDEALRETRERFGADSYLVGRLAFLYAQAIDKAPDEFRRPAIQTLLAEAATTLRTAPEGMRHHTGQAYNRLGNVRSKNNDAPGAEQAYRAGIEWMRSVGEDDHKADPPLLAFLLANLASSRMDQDVQDTEVGDLLVEAVERARKIDRNGESHRWALTMRSTYLRRIEAFAELRTCLDEYRTAAAADPDSLYDLADECVRAGGAIEDATVREEYEVRAVELLTLALRHGLKNPQRLKTETIWKPIRSREDFRKLVP